MALWFSISAIVSALKATRQTHPHSAALFTSAVQTLTCTATYSEELSSYSGWSHGAIIAEQDVEV